MAYRNDEIIEDLSRQLGVPGEPNYNQIPPSYTPTQIIAHCITKLTWRESELMGEAIKAKQKDSESLTAAIVAWAEGWEEFK